MALSKIRWFISRMVFISCAALCIEGDAREAEKMKGKTNKMSDHRLGKCCLIYSGFLTLIIFILFLFCQQHIQNCASSHIMLPQGQNLLFYGNIWLHANCTNIQLSKSAHPTIDIYLSIITSKTSIISSWYTFLTSKWTPDTWRAGKNDDSINAGFW